jgi:hypothetical protein
MKPIFPFYGSKWRDAKRYPAPEHGIIIEPFAGSAGYSLWHAPRKVLLIDADPIIIGVWEYLIGVGEAEILALPDLPPGQSIDDFALPQEARWLIGFWLNVGSASPKKTMSAWAKKATHQLVWSERARQRIVGELDGIRHWKVRLGSYEGCPTAFEGAQRVTYFVDPPYVEKGRYYRVNHVDHAKLGAWCRELPGRAIVCEQQGADWLPFEPLATIKSTKGTSAEAVWINGS